MSTLEEIGDFDKDYDWITQDQLRLAYAQAEKVFVDFCENKFMEGEEIWDEIWVDGVAYDVNCYEEEFNDEVDYRDSPCHCVLHPTIETGDGWRNTDGETYIRLFTVMADLNVSYVEA